MKLETRSELPSFSFAPPKLAESEREKHFCICCIQSEAKKKRIGPYRRGIGGIKKKQKRKNLDTSPIYIGDVLSDTDTGRRKGEAHNGASLIAHYHRMHTDFLMQHFILL